MMPRLSSCAALFLTLACPMICQVAAPTRGEAERAVQSQPAMSCESCRDDVPEPAPDPCDDSSCFCSPFVLYAQRMGDEAGVPGLLPAMAAWINGRPDSAPDATRHVAAFVSASPPENRAMERSLPLLI